jgi:hypothetical protein
MEKVEYRDLTTIAPELPPPPKHCILQRQHRQYFTNSKPCFLSLPNLSKPKYFSGLMIMTDNIAFDYVFT